MSPDDPRLSAYAFGELTGEAAAEVEAALAKDPALAAEVAAIRAVGEGLESALGAESLPETEPVELGERIDFPSGRRAVKRFPYFWVSGLAAAGFAVLVFVQSPESPLVGTGQVASFEMVSAPPADVPARTLSADGVAADAVERSTSTLVEVSLPDLSDAALSGADHDPATAAALSSDRQEKKAGAIELSSFAVSATESSGHAAAGAKRVESQRMQSPQPSPPQLSMAAHRTMAMAPAIWPDSVAGEGYAATAEHGWKQTRDAPLSTFAVDVDSASYANVRRFLRSGQLPPLDAVKVEELVNAFTYDYAGPEAGTAAPLQANLEVAGAPWNPEHRLVRIGLKAQEISMAQRAPANLVFLLDVSGSMNRPEKLPLVKEALRLLVGQLSDRDRVAIVTYAGQSGLALPSTPVTSRRTITAALDELRSGGSTHGSSGIHLAYDVAKANFVEGGVNRVILCTDGDFNVGTTGLGELERLIQIKAESGVFLTALGFGTGNYQDDTLELLANRGNGTHGYIDSVREARRLLVEQVTGTLATVAQDVKIQVEFNPAQVKAYRLIGYNNRRLAAEEFNDDSVDAGEIGAGHTVTALYEVVPIDQVVPDAVGSVDALRYQAVTAGDLPSEHAHELLTVKIRAQPPGGGKSELYAFPMIDGGHRFDGASPDFKFAAAVAGFGLKLRQMPGAEQFSFAQVEAWGRAGIVADPGEYRSEFLELVRQADALSVR
ncbi:MAG: vWA domain-containing protein [bacterium]